ncbi:hypothetical protein [Streptomyces sp. NPDC059788]|uniref:hypothetical protein n=1 Tax=Streptomyces sp. NPDC059788 TaxID=3346948 RepID=UPI00365724F9
MTDATLVPTLSTSPDPLQVSSADSARDGKVRVDVTPHGGAAASCERVTIAFPYGDKATDLAGTATSGSFTIDITPKGWSVQKSKAEDGMCTITVEPDHDPGVVKSNEPLRITLANLKMNTAIGKSTVTVTIDKSPTEFPCTKAPAGFEFGNLKPDELAVKNGKKTRLSWNLSSPAKLTLRWTGADDKGNITQGVFPSFQGRILEHDTPELYNTTFFQLTAEIQSGAASVDHTLTTVVMVTEPSLETGPLTVTGTTRLAGCSHPVAGDPHALNYAIGATKTYTPTTDGIVCAGLRGGLKQARLTFTAHDTFAPDQKGEPGDRTIQLTARPGEWAYTEFFVAAGNFFTVGGLLDPRETEPTNPASGLYIRWIALGSGTLTAS